MEVSQALTDQNKIVEKIFLVEILFLLKLYFWPKTSFLTENIIFDQKHHFRPKHCFVTQTSFFNKHILPKLYTPRHWQQGGQCLPSVIALLLFIYLVLSVNISCWWPVASRVTDVGSRANLMSYCKWKWVYYYIIIKRFVYNHCVSSLCSSMSSLYILTTHPSLSVYSTC